MAAEKKKKTEKAAKATEAKASAPAPAPPARLKELYLNELRAKLQEVAAQG